MSGSRSRSAPGSKADEGLFERLHGHQPMEGGGHRRDEELRRSGAQTVEGRHAAGDQSHVRRRGFIGQRFPFRKPGDGLRRWIPMSSWKKRRSLNSRSADSSLAVRTSHSRWRPLPGLSSSPRAASKRARRRRSVQADHASPCASVAQRRAQRRQPWDGVSGGLRHASRGR